MGAICSPATFTPANRFGENSKGCLAFLLAVFALSIALAPHQVIEIISIGPRERVCGETLRLLSKEPGATLPA